MVKVVDPDGVVIGVFDSREDVPPRLSNRLESHWFDVADLEIVEVTNAGDETRLLKTLERCRIQYPSNRKENVVGMTWEDLLQLCLKMSPEERKAPVKVFDYRTDSFLPDPEVCVDGNPCPHLTVG